MSAMHLYVPGFWTKRVFPTPCSSLPSSSSHLIVAEKFRRSVRNVSVGVITGQMMVNHSSSACWMQTSQPILMGSVWPRSTISRSQGNLCIDGTRAPPIVYMQ